MAPSRPHRYQTHFFCSLCGAPFAQAYRTATKPIYAANSDDAEGEAEERDEDEEENYNTDISHEFNISESENAVIPPEVWLKDMNEGAKRERAAKARREMILDEKDRRLREKRGLPPKEHTSEHRTVRTAYDGRLISIKDMEWSKDLRAIINQHAQHHPEDHQLNPEYNFSSTYLTGRGLIRQYDNEADAYAAIDFEEYEDTSRPPSRYPQFDPFRNHKFHLYQEPNLRPQHIVCSFPFHDECYSLLDSALEAIAEDLGWEGTIYWDQDDPDNEDFNSDQKFYWLREFLGGVPDVKKGSFGPQHLVEGDSRKEVSTRLAEINYREAQGCSEGYQWRHEDGLHWLLADPNPPIERYQKPVPAQPSNGSDRVMLGKGNGEDAFGKLPPEIIFMIYQHLDHPADFFALRHASPAVAMCPILDVWYKSFVRTEFRHLRKLIQVLDDEGPEKKYDWKATYRQLRQLLRSPSPNAPVEEWQGVDINLKNRCRIWRIVKPIAEYIFQTTAIGAMVKHNAYYTIAERMSMPRGLLGVQSGKRGQVESAYFGSRSSEVSAVKEQAETGDGPGTSDAIATEVFLTSLRVWMDVETGDFTGLGFYMESEGKEILEKVGTITGNYKDLTVKRGLVIEGFNACFNGEIISGIQFIFRRHMDQPEIPSERFGNWDNAPDTDKTDMKTYGSRRIVASRGFRELVGVIGFVNSRGYLETFSTLEERISNPTIPPPHFLPPRRNTVTHEKESCWKYELPPPNTEVELIQRIGPHLNNWRTMPAEWVLWEMSAARRAAMHKHGGLHSLTKIEGFFDSSYMRGLRFHFTHRKPRSIGSTDEKKWTREEFDVRSTDSEKFTALVISEDNGGIRGCMFLTTMSRISPYYGPRYKGNHRVQNSLISPRTPGPEEVYDYLQKAILGLHAVYDYENERFLQLGIIVDQSDNAANLPRATLPVPFSIHAGEDGCAMWEDTILPPNYIKGCRNLRTNKGNSRARFAGWVEFKGLRRVEVYGNMNGIKFLFWNGKQKFFGDCKGAVVTQEFSKTAVITGIVEVKSGGKEGNGEKPFGGMKRIMFLSGAPSNAQRQATIKKADSIIESTHLFAIKFLFSCDRLHYWSPIYDPRLCSAQERLRLTSPWKLFGHPSNFSTEIREPSERVAFVFFDEVDAIKGYVRNSGNLCGMAFRRNGKWDEEVFGDPSGLEVPLMLKEKERFTSARVSMFMRREPETQQHRDSNGSRPLPVAIAFTTNLGRVTPWLGNPVSSGENVIITKDLLPPPNSSCIGICASLDVHDPLFKSIGLICRPHKDPVPKPSSENPNPIVPRRLSLGSPSSSYHTGLNSWPWLAEPTLLEKQKYNLGALSRLGNRNISGDFSNGDYHPQRTYNIFDPALLTRIFIYSNHSFRFGIKGISLHGLSTMGAVYFGAIDSPSEVDESGVKGMDIDGPNGERIIDIRTGFGQDGKAKYVVGLRITTNWGREIDLLATGAAATLFSAATPSQEETGVLRVEEGREFVGLHTVLNKFNFFDLGLITLPTPAEGARTAIGVESSTSAAAANEGRRIDPFELYKGTWK